MMRTSQKGIDLIKSFEGCRLKAYKCPSGIWTVGYGHTSNVKPATVITKEKAEELLREDLKIFEKHVETRCAHLKLNQNEFDALVSFCYNNGSGGLNNLIRNRNKKQIADAMLLYNKGGGKVLEGLVRRRKVERELFLTRVV